MPAVDFVELCLEESPFYDGVPTTPYATPYRLTSEKLYLPVRSARIGPGVQHLDRSDELRGIQAAPARLIDTYDPDGSLSIRAYPKALTWLLALSGFQYAHTTGDGIITDPDATAIPATTHRWVFTKKDAITAPTGQVQINHKDEAVLLKGNGYGISQLSGNAVGEITADLMGLVLKRLAVDTTTVPAYPAQSLPPFRRRELLLTWLGGGARAADFSWQIANPLERVRTLSLATPTPYPDVMEYGDSQVYLTGSIPKRALNATDFDALLAATTFSAKARFKSTSNILATSYPYSMWIEMPACQLVGGNPDDMGNKRRVGASYDFFAAYSEGSGYDVKVTLVNDVASIDTWVP